MKFNKKAFTLTELLIALGVVGVLAVILMPVITNMLPDQNAIMAKRAYYTVQNVVSDMINNGECYPDTSKAASADLKRIGFDDGYRYPNCENWELDANNHFYTEDQYEDKLDEDGNPVLDEDGNHVQIKTHSAGDPIEGEAGLKFSKIFQSLIDKDDNFNGVNEHHFKTKDGIEWRFLNLDNFNTKNTPDPDSCVTLYVDVNGSKEPNRRDTGDGAASNFFSDRTTKKVEYNSDNPDTYDVFSMYICPDGKVTIRDKWANSAIDVEYDLQSK